MIAGLIHVQNIETMNININVNDMVPNYRETERKRSEIWRQYKDNLIEIDKGRVEIIPHYDERLNHLSQTRQELVMEVNELIKNKGTLVSENLYEIPGDERPEVKDNMEYLVTSIKLGNEMREIARIQVLLFAILLAMAFLMVQGDGNPYEALFGLMSGL